MQVLKFTTDTGKTMYPAGDPPGSEAGWRWSLLLAGQLPHTREHAHHHHRYSYHILSMGVEPGQCCPARLIFFYLHPKLTS